MFRVRPAGYAAPNGAVTFSRLASYKHLAPNGAKTQPRQERFSINFTRTRRRSRSYAGGFSLAERSSEQENGGLADCVAASETVRSSHRFSFNSRGRGAKPPNTNGSKIDPFEPPSYACGFRSGGAKPPNPNSSKIDPFRAAFLRLRISLRRSETTEHEQF
jgi:hypothetical protein